jgi:hypothetical protein
VRRRASGIKVANILPQSGGDDAKAFGGQLTPVSFVVGLFPFFTLRPGKIEGRLHHTDLSDKFQSIKDDVAAA